jgi:hypothetical protein
VAKKPNDIISTRLRLPAGLHRMLAASAKRNNRSINSEILWSIARHLGDEAQTFVKHMEVEQRRTLHNVLRALIADPEKAAQAIASFDKRMEDER